MSAGAAHNAARSQHAARMDRMYRSVRHVYDASRRFYLFGRDTLLRRVRLDDGQAVLEVGCGTARNLRLLARRHPGVRLFGLDISEEMLRTARAKVARDGLEERVVLCLSAAADLRPGLLPSQDRFDAVFFSYSLSMIPDWPAALEAALGVLAPGGRLYVVDFWDQAGLPAWFRWALRRWLAHFHVRYPAGLDEHLAAAAHSIGGSCDVVSIGGRYALLAEIRSPRPTAPVSPSAA